MFKNIIFLPRNIVNSSAFMKTIITVLRSRTSNQKLPIKTCRWNNISRNQRLCKSCKSNICDEYHCIMICPALEENKKNPIYHQCILDDQMVLFLKNHFHAKYELLYINNLCNISNIINKRFNSPGWCKHYTLLLFV